MNWDIIDKHETPSVMDDARDAAAQGAEEGMVVCARKQTAGRGQHGREWVSPQGGLYCAILLKPDWDLADASKLTLLAGVAVCETIKDLANVDARIKEPNDILIGGKKAAGILTESESMGQRLEYAVVGIGINVNTDKKDLPPEAISLRADTDLGIFLKRLLARLEFWYQTVQDSGFKAMLTRWQELLTEG